MRAGPARRPGRGPIAAGIVLAVFVAALLALTGRIDGHLFTVPQLTPPAPRVTVERRLVPPSAPAGERGAPQEPSQRPGRVALVIDDLGMNRRMTRQAIALPAAVTLAFLPYAPDVAAQAAAARAAGHELLVHLPMEPEGGDDPGPMALTSGLDRRTFLDRLGWNLTRFDGYVGVNNHMGSRLTADRRAMGWLMRDLKARGLIFLDSRTTPASVAAETARQFGLPFAVRRVFLDHTEGARALDDAYRRIRELARHGPVVAIGHPHPRTLRRVRAWLARAPRDGLAYVPISAVVEAPQPRALGSQAAARIGRPPPS